MYRPSFHFLFNASLAVGLGVTSALSASVFAQVVDVPEEPKTSSLAEVRVTSTREDLQGIATSASEGVVTSKQLRTRPLLRAGDLMESVPGLIATQHSGEGKANQYFLRGFNLDHGTDFATYVDGVPINLPSHGHGQGYTDLYFLIPELVDSIRYRKGPYYAEDGDFATAGSARMYTIGRISAPVVSVELGSFNYRRALAIASVPVGGGGAGGGAGGHWLFAGEVVSDDGPWSVRQNLRKFNFHSKFSMGTASNGWSVGLNHYEASWTATDQIPLRAVQSGQLGRYDSLDPSSGGKTQRDAVNAQWSRSEGGKTTAVSAYAIRYRFDLFSNFTYYTQGCDTVPLPSFCNGPLQGGSALDQIEQVDQRTSLGMSASHKFVTKLAGLDTRFTVGLDLRRDQISELGLFDTVARVRTNTVRDDKVRVDALGVWGESEVQWTEKFRSVFGLRLDQRRLDVQSSIAANSGNTVASIASPKLSLAYSPSNSLDLYANWGRGFHSNDARGAVIRVDPRNPTQPLDQANVLVKATGYELGARQKVRPNLTLTAALWTLKLDSELLFVGDAGTTEPSRPSQRSGIEMTVNWKLSKAFQIDADASWSRARFSDQSALGSYVPGAMERVVSLGATYLDGPFSVGARLRHFGSRALVEDNSLRGPSSTIMNLKASYRFTPKIEGSLEVFNLFNRQSNDIDYAYASRLPGEAAVSSATPASLHFHPAAPRTLRAGLKIAF